MTRRRNVQGRNVLDVARAEQRPLTVAEYKTLTKPKPLSEHAEQCRLVEEICEHLDTYPALRNFFAVPNQSGSGTAGMIRQVMMKREGLATGYPDTGLDVARGGYFGLRIELKKSADWNDKGDAPYARGLPTEDQTGWHHRLASEGYCVFVSWGWEPAWDALRWYVHLLPTSGLLRAGVARWEAITPPPIPRLRWIHLS